MVWKLSLQDLHIELFKSVGLAADGSVFQLKLIDLSGKIKTLLKLILVLSVVFVLRKFYSEKISECDKYC